MNNENAISKLKKEISIVVLRSSFGLHHFIVVNSVTFEHEIILDLQLFIFKKVVDNLLNVLILTVNFVLNITEKHFKIY